MKHFLDIEKISMSDLRNILRKAVQLKKTGSKKLLAGKQLAMIFEKPSTRTRVSFEVAINQLGGNALTLNNNDSQLGRGETIADTAKVLSRYADIIMMRTFQHETLLELAENSSVPVINGLTDTSHPCQIMADIMTFEEHKGPIKDKLLAWSGDWNNVTYTLAHAAEKFGFKFNFACPKEFAPANSLPKNTKYFEDPEVAVKNADCVITDTWISMGDEDEAYKKNLLAPYQVNEVLMKHAKKSAIFMHCLPAHREHEVTSAVMDGKQSVVFDEAENRLHVQKAIMLWCLGKI